MRLLTACFFVFACLPAPICSAQNVDNEINVGTPLNGFFHGGEVDTVQTNNGNLHIEIPIWTVPGRGPLASGATFILDTKEWIQVIHTDPSTGDTTGTVGTEAYGTAGGIIAPLHNFILTQQFHAGTQACLPQSGWYSNIVVREANGTKHHMVPDSGNTCPNVQYPVYYGDDGSGFNSKGLNKSGISFSPNMDTNGNQLPNGQDTLGRSLSDGSLTYYDSAGNAQTIQLTYISVRMNTNMCHFLIPAPDYCIEATYSQNQISQIRLANGMTYTITYVQNDMGEPSSITLPSGAQISWTYNSGDKGGPVVATRTVTANGQARTWTYNYPGTPCVFGGSMCVTSIIDPLGNETDFTYTNIYAYQSNFGAVLPYVTTKQIKDNSSGSLVLVKTENIDYSNSIGPVLPIGVTATWNQQNLVSKVETDYDSFSVSGISGLTFSASNPIARREYDWGSGGPGNLLRRTAFSYLHLANSAYLNANILDRVTGKWVYDSTNSTCQGIAQPCAQTTYSYDSTAITSTTPTPAPNHDYTGHGYTFTVRGNLTQTSRWVNTTNAWLNTTNIYDDLGNLRSTTDPSGNVTSYSYTDNFTDGGNRNAQAFVTQVTRPVTNGVNHIEKQQYFWYTSLVAASCGQNFSSACNNAYTPPQPDYAKVTYDNMFRPLTVTRGDGGVSSYSYNDLSLPLSVSTTTSITGSTNMVTTRVLDDLYRIKQTQLNSDVQVDYTDTTYDALGHVATVSNPYRSTGDPTYGITTYMYDALGRTTNVIPPDGTASSNNVSTSYSGNTKTVTDQAGKSRKSVTDELGRLTQVVEDPGGLGYVTTYAYDVLDNLTSVAQNGSRLRTFTYDSLSRLLTASNPESGMITYTYDNNGNVATKVAPAPNQTGSATVTTAYSYDALNRITQKAYSDGTPSPIYAYDQATVWGAPIQNSIGRMSLAYVSGAAAMINSYDPNGRVIQQWQSSPPQGWWLYFAYDLAGNTTSASNGAGVTISYAYNAAARPTTVTSNWVDSQHPATLASGLSYMPAGAYTAMTLGNGLLESRAYNNRLQPTEIKSYTSSNFVRYDFTYGYNDSSNHNNGNLMSWNSTGWDFNFNRSYSYDTLNRLATLGDSNSGQSCTGLSWTYDAWGNRSDQTVTGGTCNPFHATVNTKNQLVDPVNNKYQYDAAGNMIQDASHTYTYDAENRLLTVDGGGTATYVYDALGRRVRKTTGGSSTDYVYDLSGNVVAEFGGAVWSRGYVYLGGAALAQYANSTTYFFHQDHLGSTRLVTGVDGGGLQSWDYLPYGELLSGVFTTNHLFTGKERDSESGLDNFGARYDASSLGRFMTTDPVVVTSERLRNPQQLNLYSYVANNPLRFIDPTGELLTATGNLQADYKDLCAIAGDACADRLKIDEKTGNVTFDTTGLDLSKNEGAKLVNDLVSSKSTYEFSEGPTVMTDKGPVKIDYIGTNLPAFGDQRQIGNPRVGVSDVVAFNFNNKNVTRISNTNLGVAPNFTYAFHELAEAFEKIDGGKGGSYEAGHNAALQRELTLRDQRPYLKQYNTGAGGPANSPHPEGGIIIKK